MKTTSLVVTSVFALSIFFGPTSYGRSIPVFSESKLFTESVRVAVIQVVDDERLTGNRSAARAQVVQQFSGAGLPEQLSLVFHDTIRPFDGGAPILEDSFFVAFLRPIDDGKWTLTDPNYGLFRVSNVRAADMPSGDVRDDLRLELHQSLRSADAKVIQASLKALTALADRDPLDRARLLSKSENVRVATEALKYRSAMGDTSGLGLAVKLIEEDNDLQEGEKDLLAWSLAGPNLRFPLDDLRDILIGATNPTLRRVAATILSQQGNEASLAALMTGLAADDLETQYRCVVGLSRIAGRAGPGYKEFMANPKPTVTNWTAWWDRESQRYPNR